MLTIRSYQPADEEAVINLWGRCGLLRPVNDPRKDIARKLRVRGDLFLIGVHAGEVVATAMVGYEGHRGWINYLGVSPDYRKHGFGRQMMAEAERRLRAEGCAKINLQVRNENTAVLAFYRELGYLPDPLVCLGKRLESDLPSGQ